MVQISGTYNKGTITLDKIVAVNKPVKVIVMFDEEDITIEKERLSINDFSFL